MDAQEIYSHEDWRGRIRASVGISASLPQEKVCLFDEEHGEMLKERFLDDLLAILHRLFVLIGRIADSQNQELSPSRKARCVEYFFVFFVVDKIQPPRT